MERAIQTIPAAVRAAAETFGDATAIAGLGALCAGATLVPVNTRFTGPEALDVIARSTARALFVAGPFLGADRLALLAAAAAQEGTELPGLVVRIPVEPELPRPASAGAAPAPSSWTEFLARAAQVPEAAAAERADAVVPDDVSDILFTSGTTGPSKGAMSAHRQALDVAKAWSGCAQLTSADRYLIVNPFFHSFGYKAGILACLLTGATMVPQLVFDAGQAMRLIEDMRITVFPGAPTIYSSILDHSERGARDLSSLRLAVTGAAVVPVALVERMRAELTFDEVLTAYGLTEAVVVTMCRPGDDPRTVATTSGRATAGFEIQIAGGGGEPGEILLRGPNVMLGYLDDAAATAAAIDADGWLHTGDVGVLDERGYLTITDRLKDMYICGGFNVYPAEVEQVLTRHPAVAEAAVIGVPDGRLGEVGKAFVVPRPAAGPGAAEPGAAEPGAAELGAAEPGAAELIEFCRTTLANYKVPRQIEFRADLPRNPAGKPLKRLLRAREAERPPETPADRSPT